MKVCRHLFDLKNAKTTESFDTRRDSLFRMDGFPLSLVGVDMITNCGGGLKLGTTGSSGHPRVHTTSEQYSRPSVREYISEKKVQWTQTETEYKRDGCVVF